MDEVAAQIIGVDGRSLEKLHLLLKSASQNVLCLPTSENKDPLLILNPSAHTLGYLHILVARLTQAQADPAVALDAAAIFVDVFDRKQVNIAPEHMNMFGQAIFRLAERLQRPLAAIGILRKAILRWPESPTFLTPLHPILFKACILAKNYNAALPVLSVDISEVQPHAYNLRVQDFLLHHYYGAMLWIGLKRFDRAFEFLQLCITAPASVCSFVQVEAYRKYVLVSLILLGSFEPPPKYTSAAVIRACTSSLTGAYTDFAQSTKSGSVSRIQQSFVKHHDAFAKHRNLGLAKQCVQSFNRRHVQQLTQTYITLSVADIAKGIRNTDSAFEPPSLQRGQQMETDTTLEPDTIKEVERLVLRMVEENQVYATISHRDGGMVSFHDLPDEFNTDETATTMDEQIRKSIAISERVSRLSKEIGLSKDYVSKTMQAELIKGSTDRASATIVATGGPGGPGFGPNFDDEMQYEFDSPDDV
ncbi:hypothetical protein BJ742DRAFT_709843 [Cladochytrium replicatum]|nr:hypothetical protein BJ742DRAFT_709843 [Cladochytrium replicatum]